MAEKKAAETVKVMVRCRPMNNKEKTKGCAPIVEVDTTNQQIVLTKPDSNEMPKTFAYDATYPPDVQQQIVYDDSAFSLVESVLEGYNGTIFAYGQTGCGKTHTMVGYEDNDADKGIIPRCFDHIFGVIDDETSGKKFLVRCSYLEIYNENILDLLGKNHDAKLEVKEDP